MDRGKNLQYLIQNFLLISCQCSHDCLHVVIDLQGCGNLTKGGGPQLRCIEPGARCSSTHRTLDLLSDHADEGLMTGRAFTGFHKYTCWGLEKPMRCDVMLSFCKAHLIASCKMLEPCACAYSAARLQAALTSCGAGCHAGGPWEPQRSGIKISLYALSQGRPACCRVACLYAGLACRHACCARTSGTCASAHLFSEQAHAEQAGIDDAHALALQVGHHTLQGGVVEAVVAV